MQLPARYDPFLAGQFAALPKQAGGAFDYFVQHWVALADFGLVVPALFELFWS